MSILFAKQLLQRLERARTFPIDGPVSRSDLVLYQSIRESEISQLKPKWWNEEYETSREFVIDPLGERIPEVWADLLFGEEPEFEPVNKGNQDDLEKFTKDNKLPTNLHYAEEISSSEGEVWWRLLSVPSMMRVFIEWHSRLNVEPYFIGNKLVAVAFISWLEISDSKQWIYVEVHSEGVVLNRLYHNTIGSQLGKPRELTEREETAELRPLWTHPLPMLAGRLLNKRGRDWRIGKSDYKGVSHLLLALNELQNIGQDNARLTAKQRVVIPERFLTARGQMPRGAEIIVATEVDADPTKVKNDMAQVEWSFDAEKLIAWKGDMVETILTRTRIAPELISKNKEGGATLPAKRADLLDTVLRAQSKAKKWDDELPGILKLAWQLENLAISQGGCSADWGKVDGDKEPIFKRNGSLPEDEETRSRRIVTEVNAKILSKRTAIQVNNPTYGPDRVDEEIAQIEKEETDSLKRMQQFKDPPDPSDPQQKDAADKGVQDPGRLPLQPGKRRSTARPNPERQVKT